MSYDVIVAQVISAAWKLGIAGGVWWLTYPIKRFFKKVKETAEKIHLLDEVRNELTVQRTNCLATLQEQGDTQISVLKEISETLKDNGKVQAEMYGYMKGSS